MIALLLALALPQASPTPAPSVAPSVAGSALPAAMDGVKALTLPATPAPGTPTAAPVYNYVWHPPQSTSATPFPDADTPQILEIDATDQRVTVPGPVHVRILTSDAVVSVTATAYGYGVVVPKRAAGVFAFDGVVPVVPDNAKNKMFDIDVTAQSKSGRTVTYTLPFMLK